MNVQELFRTIEDVAPLSAHATTFDAWASQVHTVWEDHGMVQIPELEALLDFREDLLLAATQQDQHQDHEATTGSDWEWLLTAPQVEQRTTAWYNQAKTVLTGSEIGELFKGPRSLASLVLSKALFNPDAPEAQSPNRILAVPRLETKATDWGIRYEPVVKQHLEKSLACKIHELGRICHRDPLQKVAASPDGLFVDGPAELVGRLVEIKCPLSRLIKPEIPIDYWRQMQLQLECTGLQACEYVEAKFKERALNEPVSEGSLDSGIITLVQNSDTLEHRYFYEATEPHTIEDPWTIRESYAWDLVHFRRTTVLKDPTWFPSIQPNLLKFWETVEAFRNGTWSAPPPRPKKVKATEAPVCAIQDSDDETPASSLQLQSRVSLGSEETGGSDIPAASLPTSYTM
jgi:hypothetical protein